MTKKIFRWIFLVAVIVLFSAFVLIMGVLYTYFGAVQENQLRTELALASGGVEAGGIPYLEKIGRTSSRFTYISKDGTVWYDSWSSPEEMENHAGREEVKQAMETGEGESVRYSATLTEKTLYCAKRLSDGSILRLSVSRMTVLALFLGMLNPILIILTLALILSLVLARHMSKKILKPLSDLNLDRPLENDVYDELSPMLTRMEQQMRQIRRQEEELSDRKKEFYAVIKNMQEGLVLLNCQDKILSINPAAAGFFGAREDWEGRDFLTLERSHEFSTTLDAAKTKGHSEMETGKGGREYQINISRIDAGHKPFGMVILIFDITEKVSAERCRREFTANVSHELKTPLHSIMGSAELMENGLVKEEDMPEFIRRIRLESARLVALIEDIIRLSQLDEKTRLPLEDIDLYELAEEEMESLAQAAERKNISLSIEGEKTVMRGARQLLHEIVFNLCDNAIKYNREKGGLTVTVGRQGEDVFLSVTDTGIGIPEEDQERIFERFYRVDKSRSKERGGTGLGLSIVKHAVQYMEGRISLCSRPGEGTTITVYFPAIL